MAQYKAVPGYAAPGQNSQIVALNASGVAAGTFFTQGQHGYIGRGGGAQPVVVDFAGASSTELTGIDDANDVVGNYFDVNGGHAFARLANGTDVKLEASLPDTVTPQNSSILAASGSGEVVGTYFSQGANRLFEAKLGAGGFTDFKTVDFRDNGQNILYDNVNPLGVNNDGDIVGYYDSNGKRYGFVEHNGTSTTLQPSGDSQQTIATGINQSGEIVGFYLGGDNTSAHAFTYTAADGIKTLDVDVAGGKNTKAFAVNDSGQVTGTYEADDGRFVGFVLTGNDLTTIDTGNVDTDLRTINNKGLVGGDILSGALFAAVFGPDSPAGGAAYSISASGDVEEGTPPGAGHDITFTVTRSDASSAGNVQVDLSGTATKGVDYTVSGLGEDNRISFAANQASKTFTVRSAPDSDVES